MKAAMLWACVGLAVLLGAASAAGSSHTVIPTPPDLQDLPHQYYYSWGFSVPVPPNERITGAVLSVTHIYNWASEPHDWLYIHLLDNPALGVHAWWDGQGGGDNWASWPLVAAYSDPDDAASAEDLSYDLAALGLLDEFTAYAADGTAGFGFDPDCHYYNWGWSFTYTTAPIPEPGTAPLLLSGALPLVGLARWRRRS